MSPLEILLLVALLCAVFGIFYVIHVFTALVESEAEKWEALVESEAASWSKLYNEKG